MTIQEKKETVLKIMKAYNIGLAEVGKHMKQIRNGKPLTKPHVWEILYGSSKFETYEDQFIPALNVVLDERGFEVHGLLK